MQKYHRRIHLGHCLVEDYPSRSNGQKSRLAAIIVDLMVRIYIPPFRRNKKKPNYSYPFYPITCQLHNRASWQNHSRNTFCPTNGKVPSQSPPIGSKSESSPIKLHLSDFNSYHKVVFHHLKTLFTPPSFSRNTNPDVVMLYKTSPNKKFSRNSFKKE